MSKNTTWEKVKNYWIKWGKIGDYIEGTLIDVREIDSQFPGNEGKRVKIYELQADSGTFHEKDGTAVTVEEGIVWTVGGRPGIDQQMRRVKIGTKIKMTFTEERKAQTKGFNALKIIEVYTGRMDDEYLADFKQ